MTQDVSVIKSIVNNVVGRFFFLNVGQSKIKIEKVSFYKDWKTNILPCMLFILKITAESSWVNLQNNQCIWDNLLKILNFGYVKPVTKMSRHRFSKRDIRFYGLRSV